MILWLSKTEIWCLGVDSGTKGELHRGVWGGLMR